jgi:hypothetical protein
MSNQEDKKLAPVADAHPQFYLQGKQMKRIVFLLLRQWKNRVLRLS